MFFLWSSFVFLYALCSKMGVRYYALCKLSKMGALCSKMGNVFLYALCKLSKMGALCSKMGARYRFGVWIHVKWVRCVVKWVRCVVKCVCGYMQMRLH